VYVSKDEGSASVSAHGLLLKLELAKSSELWRFVTALSIRLIGPEVAKPLAERFNTLLEILEAEPEDISAIQGVGELAAKSIKSWWHNPENKEIVGAWISAGISPKKVERQIRSNSALAGKLVLVTGSLQNYDREQIKEVLLANGARVASGPTANVDLVVIGEKAGPAKLKKIADLGLRTIDESELENLLGENETWETNTLF
jgi:DNA ligase (NAD+)